MTQDHERAHRLARVLRNYGNDETECLVDILTDARHWCDRHDLSFASLDRIAYQHYLAELDGEG